MALGTLGVIAATAAVGSTALSINAAKKGSKAQREANAAQEATNRLRNRQAKRQFLRGFRQAQANTIIASVAAGVGIDSSAFQGTLQSEQSQRSTAVREFKEADDLGAEFASARDRATSASFRSNTFSTISNFATQFVSFGGF